MNNEIEMRDLTRADLYAVTSVLDDTQLFPAELLADMAEPFLDQRENHIWRVARHRGAVIGFAYCEPERMTEGCWNLLAIAVVSSSQGTGIGQAIVADIASAVDRAGGRVLLVETSGLEAFKRTRAFYEQLGFDREARIRDYYSDGEDKIVFWKRIVLTSLSMASVAKH